VDYKTQGKGLTPAPPEPPEKIQEEVMKFVHQAAIAAMFTAFALAPAASAAGLGDCIAMGKQATEALNTAQPGLSTDAARTQANAGRNFCAMGMYAQGVARYSKAMQLLGKA
jgi:hypothetical protein